MKIYRESEEHLGELLKKRARLEKAIARLTRFMYHLKSVIDEQGDSIISALPQEPLGPREVCIEVLKGAYRPLNASDVIAGLRELGYDTGKYANPYAVVGTTLKRLVESKEVVTVTGEDGKVSYLWNELYPFVPEKYGL